MIGISTIVGWVLGPVTTAVTSYLNKKEDVALEKYKEDGKVNIAAMEQDTRVTEALARLAEARKDDPVDRWGRRFFIYPIGIWFSLIVYDSCFRDVLPDYMTWRVLALPENLEYTVYGVFGYLFVKVIKK